MKVIFAGTPEFARLALQRLHQAGHTIALVLTQPDRPAGRGMKLQASAVKQYAMEHAMPVSQPRSLRLDGKYPDDAAAARDAILAAQADVMVVAAYGLLLLQWVLDTMAGGGAATTGKQDVPAGPWGCLNIHGSLLPRWRGAAPIHRAIEAGDAETGVTIMQMDVGLDTGDMLLRRGLPIENSDTTATLHDKVAELGAGLIVQALAGIAGLLPVAQPPEGVTYAHKIEKSESPIDWQLPAPVIDRRVRAFNPFPAASFVMGEETIKVWRTALLPQDDTLSGVPGQVLAAGPDGIDVAAGHGVVRLLELQRPGGKRLPAAEFLRGFEVPTGTVLAGPQPLDSPGEAPPN